MAIVLGDNRYGKAEVRLVRIDRGAGHHGLTDLNVTVSLSGDMADTHLTGANDKVLATDTQKNTVFAFARDGIRSVEDFGLRLARHFVDSQPSIHRARVRLEQFTWSRLGPHSFAGAGGGHPHRGRDLRRRTVVGGLRAHWDKSYDTARQSLLDAFAGTYSYSLQQTPYAMGERVLTNDPGIAEVRLRLPNKHHFLSDLTPFGLDNPGEVFHAADRPYGLIEGTVLRDDAPPARPAWD